MTRILLALIVVCVALTVAPDVRAYYPSVPGRYSRGQSWRGTPSHNHTSRFPAAGRAPSVLNQGISAPLPGWYFPGLGSAQFDDFMGQKHQPAGSPRLK